MFAFIGLQHGTIHVDQPFGLPLEYNILPQELKKVGKISACLLELEKALLKQRNYLLLLDRLSLKNFLHDVHLKVSSPLCRLIMRGTFTSSKK